MTEKDFILLNNINEALLTISTKGQDTVIMGRVLEALRDFLQYKQQEIVPATNNEEV